MKLTLCHLQPKGQRYEIFSNIFGNAPPRIISRKPDKLKGKVSQTISFKSLNIEALNYYFELFYIYNTTTIGKVSKEAKRRNIQIIPDNIQDLLTSSCFLDYGRRRHKFL